MEPDGAILIADSIARRVRRVDVQGFIRTVAGTGGRTIAGDGGPATAASLGYPQSVAALPGGGFAIASPELRGGPPGERGTPPAIRIVDANGIITTRARVSATNVTAEPDGSLLVADWTRSDGRVRRLRPDGDVSLAVDVASDRVGIPEFPRVVGDAFRSDDIQIDAAVSTFDDGLLVAADFGIFYVAPTTPTLLALALRPETRHVEVVP